jgi:5-methylthioadenosine/S-adenosylhomocysteine deaminase
MYENSTTIFSSGVIDKVSTNNIGEITDNIQSSTRSIITVKINGTILKSGICDVAKLRENGITVGLGTDGIGSTTTMDMFEEMKTAAYLQNVSTKEPGVMSAYDILKMATIDGAKVLGMEDQIGTLEPGKKADMIFIKTDKIHMCPANDVCYNLVYSSNGADVESVMIDGKIIMQNRKMINLDEKQVMRQVKKIAKRLL